MIKSKKFEYGIIIDDGVYEKMMKPKWWHFKLKRSIKRLKREFKKISKDEISNFGLEMQKWMNQRPPDNWRDEDFSADKLFNDVINKAKQFETILLADLQTLATYLVTQKGAYYIPDIIDRTEIVLPESIQVKISENAYSTTSTAKIVKVGRQSFTKIVDYFSEVKRKIRIKRFFVIMLRSLVRKYLLGKSSYYASYKDQQNSKKILITS